MWDLANGWRLEALYTGQTILQSFFDGMLYFVTSKSQIASEQIKACKIYKSGHATLATDLFTFYLDDKSHNI